MNKKRVGYIGVGALTTVLLFGGFNNCSSGGPDLSNMSKSSSSNSPGSANPQSATPAVAGACDSEGLQSYDYNAHKPIFCSQSKVWKPVGEQIITVVTCEAGNSNCNTMAGQPYMTGVRCPAGYHVTGCSANCYHLQSIRLCHSSPQGTDMCVSQCQGVNGESCRADGGVIATCAKLAD